MKILFLTPWYPDDKLPHHGVFVRDQAGAVSTKHQVIVISAKVDYATFGFFSWSVTTSSFGNVEEHRLVMNRSIPFFNQINYLLLSIWLSWKVGRKFKPDIIHGNIAYPGAIWSYCLSRLLSRPFIVSDHTSRFTDNFRSKWHKVLTVFSLRRAGRIIAVSSWSARNIREVIRREVDVVPNLIHVNDYAIVPSNSTVVQVGFLGGLSTDRKGLDVLIKAIAQVRRNFVVHIGGQGRLLEHYRQMALSHEILDKCHFHGFVRHVPDFMKQLHFFVSSSRMEAFGMVIVEAMACGLPVIATASGGPSDYMNNDCGRLVPVDDVEALRSAFEWMIDHYNAFDRDQIRNRVKELYSSEAFLSRIDHIYRDVLKPDPSALETRST